MSYETRDCIRLIEIVTEEQQQLNKVYNKFNNFVKSEMNEKLRHKTVHIKNGLSNKRHRAKKAYWSENLSVLWNDYVDAERQASHAYGREKQRLRAVVHSRRDELNRGVQAANRRHWRQMQENLLQLQTDNPKEYWKFIGNLGIAKEQSNCIPWEAITPEEVVITDPDLVLQQWKNDFQWLLNINDENVVQEPVDTGLEDIISLEEIKLAVRLAKC